MNTNYASSFKKFKIKSFRNSVYRYYYLSLINRNYFKSTQSKDDLCEVTSGYKSLYRHGNININDIIFTTNRGVYLLDYNNNRIHHILKGKYYGLTKYNECWLLSKSNNYNLSHKPTDKSRRQSEIIAIKISEKNIVDFCTVLKNIPGEVHQIDVFNDYLYIPHTGFNQILRFSLVHLLNNFPHKPKTLIDCSAFELDIFKPSHLNSIYILENADKALLIAHNLTAHTQRHSDILSVSNNGKVNLIKTKAHSAHNICMYKNKMYYCDSNNSRLVCDQSTIFKSKTLLRGLSISNKHIFVGGSEIDFEGARRAGSDGHIYILNHKGDLIEHLSFSGVGNLYEIRQLVDKDFTLSNNNCL